ncbi:hypothetical protein GYMLUDRAFT_86407 [Collybiopsis luxurians FD-317 M1]|uniref:Uncharacterized protein n=1 Tax=Collybiopsis luxurians FD-317 M1 TaxID=944289 RepID=A0A0D0B404_9AGAR|nr:hypothetical protein GYMLUDRAFT_86407 [Collybiopsis luxurians FD-317 M1]
MSFFPTGNPFSTTSFNGGSGFASYANSNPWRAQTQNQPASSSSPSSTAASAAGQQSRPAIQYALTNVPISVQQSIAEEDVPTRPNTPEAEPQASASAAPDPSTTAAFQTQPQFATTQVSQTQTAWPSDPAPSSQATTSSPFRFSFGTPAPAQTQMPMQPNFQSSSNTPSLLERLGIEQPRQEGQQIPQNNEPSPPSAFAQAPVWFQQQPPPTSSFQPFFNFGSNATLTNSQPEPQPVQTSNFTFSIQGNEGNAGTNASAPAPQTSWYTPTPSDSHPQYHYQHQSTASAYPITGFSGYPAAAAGGIASEIFQMLNLVAQIGPSSYPAAHRLFTAASEAHAAAADMVASFPNAFQQQQQAQAQIQLSSSNDQSAPGSESFVVEPLETQSSFWDDVQTDTRSSHLPPLRPVFPNLSASSAAVPRHSASRVFSSSTRSRPVAGSEVKGKKRAFEGTRGDMGGRAEEVSRRFELQRSRIESTYEGLRLAQELQKQHTAAASSSSPVSAQRNSPSPPPAYEQVTTHVRRNRNRNRERERNDSQSRRTNSSSSNGNRRRRPAAAVPVAVAKQSKDDGTWSGFLSQLSSIFA